MRTRLANASMIFMIFLLAFMPLAPATGLASAPEAPAESLTAVMVPGSAQPLLNSLGLTPARALDYGGFHWLWLDPADYARLSSSGQDFQAFPEAGDVQISRFRFDPLVEGEPELEVDFTNRSPAAGFRLVQFFGPVQANWLTSLENIGLKPLQYYPHYAYLVWGSAEQAVQAESLDFVRWQGSIHPAYKINTDLDARSGRINNIGVFLYNDGNLSGTLNSLRSLGTTLVQAFPAQPDKAFYIAIIQADAAAIPAISRLNSVLWLGYSHPQPEFDDEMSSQIVAGNYTAGVPFTGYEDWLGEVDLDGSGVIWATIDSGVDYDHPDLGPNIVGGYSFPGACAPAGQPGSDCSNGGHGTHVTGIIGGTGVGDAGGPYTDPNGFLYGLGVAPGYGIFAMNSLSGSAWPPTGGWQEHSKQAVLGNAVGGNNSWTTGEGTQHGYQASERTHDIMVLDGNFDTTTVAEPFIEVFSAGNSGTAGLTAPKEGKNLIIVASSRNYRAGSIDTISSFSSRGPAVDGRFVPTITTPGEQIASTANDLGGDCSSPIAGTNNLYAYCSGTSMAAPHASGAVVLITEWWRGFNSGADPSAEMAKALLVNTAVDMGTPNAWNIEEGWGRVNLANLFQAEVPIQFEDELVVFDNTGESVSYTISVADTSQPLKITVAWSDAPGAVGANPALVNNLDLTVVTNGQTYRGNNFSNGWSVPGGSADTINNLENVYVQNPGASAVVTISATNIAGDAILYSGDTTDQDFAYVCQNCQSQPDFTIGATPAEQDVCIPDPAVVNVQLGQVLGYAQSVTLSTVGVPAGYSPAFDPNPLVPPASSQLTMSGSAAATDGSYIIQISGAGPTQTHTAEVVVNLFDGVPELPSLVYPADGEGNIALNPTLTWQATPGATGYLVELSDRPDFSVILYSASTTASSHIPSLTLDPGVTYFWRVKADNVCGTGAYSATYYFTTELRFCQAVGLSIPDNQSGGLTSSLTLPPLGNISDLNLVIVANHTWVGDLSFTLSNGSASSLAIDRPGYTASGYGCSGDNINVTLDDEAASDVEGICSGTPPAISGTHRPNNPFSVFDSTSLEGTWTLTARDHVAGYTGSLVQWCLLPALDAPVLFLEKSSEAEYPAPGEIFTYTITVENYGTLPASGAVISDTMPEGISFIGPVTLTPAQPGATLAQTAADLPQLAANLEISAGASVSLAFPVMVAADAEPGSQIINTAAVTSTQVVVPVYGSASTQVNRAPQAVDDEYSLDEDQVLNVASGSGVLANDSDPEGASLTASLVTAPMHGEVEIMPDGSFVYTPTLNFNGSDAFTYQITDGNYAREAEVSLTIAALNDTPQFDSEPALTAVVGSQYSYAISTSDVDAGEALTLTTSGLPAWLSLVDHGDGTGSLFGTPAASDVGSIEITLRVIDLAGAYSEQVFTLEVVLTVEHRIFLPAMLAN